MDQIAAKFDDALPDVREEMDRDSVLFLALAVFLGVVIVHACVWLIAGFDQPIADLHQFRQTQTAVTVYWLWQGGPWFAYETPVLGYPWAVPFEFPFYQYMVALLRLIGIPIAEGGRLVSFAFYLGLLWPLRVLLRNLGFSKTDYLVFAVLLLASPLYLYWSRTVMIESTAVFFGLAWLAFLIQYLRTQRGLDAAAALIFGILAINTKLTTFPGFGIVGAIVFAGTAYRMYRAGLNDRTLRVLLVGVCIGLAPLATGLAWVAYTDQLKNVSLLNNGITSSGLFTWNFGTLEQRLSFQFWQSILVGRILPDTLGYGAIAGLIVCGATLASNRSLTLLGLSILGFFTPMLIFTNLHIEHNYYQYSNALFLLAAVGFGVCTLLQSGRRVLAMTMLGMVVLGQVLYFNVGFARVIVADATNNREVQMGHLAKSLTQPGETLIVLGEDWNSAIAYEAERKALTLPYWATTGAVTQIVGRPEAYLDGMKLGGIVYCPDQMQRYQANYQILMQFVSGRAVLGQAGGCQFLSPTR